MRKKTVKTLLWSLFTLVLISAFAMPKGVPSPVDSIDTAEIAEEPTLLYEPCSMANTAFQHGEEIVYKLYYNWNFVWISAGEVVFKVEETPEGQYYFSAKGRTYKSYDWAFKVRDHYEAYVDKENLLPTQSIRQVQEGGYSLYDKMNYDQPNRKVTSLRGKTKEKATLKEFELEECMHDILSIVYYARNIEFQNYNSGQSFPVKIFMDKEVWPLTVKYKGKEEAKKIKGQGKFNTIKFSPEVIVGDVFSEGTEMNVYVSDDQNHIPLLIESPISVGSVKAVLKEYKGLKYDLSSKIK